MQTMQAAPALPPASEDAPAGSGSTGFGADLELVDHVPAPAPAEPTHAPSPAPAARPVAAPLAAAPSVAPRAAHPGAAGRLAAMTRQLADIHKAHLAQQAELVRERHAAAGGDVAELAHVRVQLGADVPRQAARAGGRAATRERHVQPRRVRVGVRVEVGELERVEHLRAEQAAARAVKGHTADDAPQRGPRQHVCARAAASSGRAVLVVVAWWAW